MKEYNDLKEAMSHLKIASDWAMTTDVTCDIEEKIRCIIKIIKDRMKYIESQEEE